MMARLPGYDPCPEGAEGVLDFGSGVRGRFTTRDGAIVGLIESHDHPEGGRCSGGLTFNVPQAEGLDDPKWTLVSLEPLTLDPSIQCTECPHHGHIRDGRWVA